MCFVLQVRWFFDRRPLKMDSNHIMEENGENNYTLTIKDIRERNLGNYTCSAVNKIGDSVATIALKGKT